MRHARLICWTLMGLLCFTSLIAAPLPVQPIPAERAQLMLDAVDEGIPFAPVLSGMHVAGEIVATPLLQVRGDDAAVINQLDTYSRTFERPLNREFVTTPVGSNYSAHSLSFSDAWRNPLDPFRLQRVPLCHTFPVQWKATHTKFGLIRQHVPGARRCIRSALIH